MTSCRKRPQAGFVWLAAATALGLILSDDLIVRAASSSGAGAGALTDPNPFTLALKWLQGQGPAGGFAAFVLLALSVVLSQSGNLEKMAILLEKVAGWFGLKPKPTNSDAVRSSSIASAPADGQGGRGGGGNAIGKGTSVVGGFGGAGGGPRGGRGGDGGGGDAVGEGSMVIGGDGGGGGRSDGRGGRGGASPLKRVSPELLKSFGLTGNEGYGRGGSGESSPEYVRSLKALNVLSAEYLSANPTGHMEPMHGVLMPPIAWVNSRLSENGEPFHVELIDNGTDFHFSSNIEEEQLDD